MSRAAAVFEKAEHPGDGSSSANVRMSANPHKLVDRTKRSHHGPIFDRDVTAQGGRISKDHMVPDLAIVGDMSVSHHQRVAPDAGNAAALHCPTVDGDELSDLAVVADFETRGLAGVSQVLRRHADRREGEDSVGTPPSDPQSPTCETRWQPWPSSTSGPMTQ